jgi:hypothetical protein
MLGTGRPVHSGLGGGVTPELLTPELLPVVPELDPHPPEEEPVVPELDPSPPPPPGTVSTTPPQAAIEDAPRAKQATASERAESLCMVGYFSTDRASRDGP